MMDLLHRFVFERLAVRGALVQLDATWQAMRALQPYPAAIADLLGEALAAASLLTSTIKHTGSLVLQMQGNGPLRLLVAECSNELALRGTARWNVSPQPAPLSQLLVEGRCAITLTGADGRAQYQGIVPLTQPSLAATLEDYMARSEQLATRVWLAAGAHSACGLLLQRLPDEREIDPDGWNRLVHLAATVTSEELATLAAPTLLRRLFPREDVRLFEGRRLRFECHCTRERVQGMLRMLGRTHIEEVLAERTEVEVICEFCGRRYAFDPAQCEALFELPSNANRPGL